MRRKGTQPVSSAARALGASGSRGQAGDAGYFFFLGFDSGKATKP